MYRFVWVSFCLISGGLSVLIGLQRGGERFSLNPDCAVGPTGSAVVGPVDRLILLLAALFLLCSLLLNNLNSSLVRRTPDVPSVGGRPSSPVSAEVVKLANTLP